jgi:hypothetical protein
MNQSNSQWMYAPTTTFPPGSAVRYYFRGVDDLGGSIADGTVLNSYSFQVPSLPGPPTIPVPGNLNVIGGAVGLGTWPNLNAASYIAYDSTYDSSTPSGSVRLTSLGSGADYRWEVGIWPEPQPGWNHLRMKLGSRNCLSLYDGAISSGPTIVLDPGSFGIQPGIYINGQAVLTNPGDYLPVNPSQLSVGVSNSVGTDAMAVGSNAQATGQNSAAFGDHTTAQGFGQFITGSYNAPQGTATSAVASDQLFVVGNGTDNTHRSNAVTVLRNGSVGIGTSSPSAKLEVQGDTRLGGNVSVTGAILLSPAGDLSMGAFTQGSAP